MNPLFNALFGSKMPQTPAPAPQMQNQSQPDWNTLMGQLQGNTAGVIKEANFNVPAEIANDPRAASMHIIQSGQTANNPMMRVIAPMLNRMGVRL